MTNKEIERKLKLFFKENKDDFVIKNINYIFDSNFYIGEKIYDFDFNFNKIEDLTKKIPICTRQQIIDIINSYLQKYKIELNLDNLIKTNVIKINKNKIKLKNNLRNSPIILDGKSANNESKIKVNVNMCLSDAFVIIHELSHYRDRPEREFNETRYLFTETLAILEELIALNDYANVDYNYDILQRIKYFIEDLEVIDLHLRIMIIYQTYGKISKEYYSKIFNSKYSDYAILKFIEYANDNNIFSNNLDKLFTCIKYNFGFIIAVHLFNRYKKDNNYMKEIQNMHKLINKFSPEVFLDYLGLKNISIEELCDPVIKFIKDYYEYSKNTVKCL